MFSQRVYTSEIGATLPLVAGHQRCYVRSGKHLGIESRTMEHRKLQSDSITVAERPANIRSRVSNGSKMLAGVDGRTAAARRYRDLVADLAADLGGLETLRQSDRALVRQAAAMTMRSEGMQAALLNGEAVDDEEQTRLENALTRTMAAISRKRRGRQHTPLRERLARQTA